MLKNWRKRRERHAYARSVIQLAIIPGCKAAIRVLGDRGYTPEEIAKALETALRSSQRKWLRAIRRL